MDKKNKTTPLNPWHRKHGANMAEFGGFDMPLWYDTGVKKEHISVIASAGLFDTSHMACVTVTQKDALKLLQDLPYPGSFQFKRRKMRLWCHTQ
ncbi:MAG: hypothetical protein U9P10_04590 [Thermodesulfobacteriota bacterium]|nr:hypothetical protein [Thermodesulfobacteriota bacterium]